MSVWLRIQGFSSDATSLMSQSFAEAEGLMERRVYNETPSANNASTGKQLMLKSKSLSLV
jgi:hypothetical protein